MLQYDATNGGAASLVIPSQVGTNTYHYLGVAMVPIAPTPTSTPSTSAMPSATATPSNTGTPTASLPEGASPTQTSSVTPSASITPSTSPSGTTTRSTSGTPSGTRTPTASGTGYPVYGGVPFTPGNVAVLRVGDGVAALSTTAAVGAIVEINPETGATVSRHERSTFQRPRRIPRPSQIEGHCGKQQ